jgi:autophagy-related protein 5
MAEDTEALRQVWDGRVPISFSLATDEVCSLDQPEQVFLFVHRMTYFPLVLDRVQRYLSRFIDQRAGHGSAEIWLEDENGMPIQWHYPVGVLYDIAMAPSSMTGGPWPITVHFRGFPEQSLIRCMSREAIESIFMSAIKEADFLKHRGQVMRQITL